MPKLRFKHLFVVLLMLSILSCNTLSILGTATAPAGEQETTQPTSGPPAPTPPAGVYNAAFATYNKPAVTLPASFTGYSLPLDLSSVQRSSSITLTPAQEAMLAQNGFVVKPPVAGEYREFYQIYEDWRYSETPLFVTTDSVLHAYHLLFDKLLRDLETSRFIPTLELFIAAMVQASQQQLTALAGTELAEPARRNLAFFLVDAQLLEMNLPIPPEVSDLVQAELALIDAHAGAAESPIWYRDDLPPDKVLREDYSQYIPRGHYTRSDDLKRYFKAMMWLGRMTFRLRDVFETQRALLITQALRTAVASDGTPAVTLWHNIYDPTVFLVGKADDLSYTEYATLSDSIFGVDAPLQAFADSALMDAFMVASETLPPPQINSMWVWIWEDVEEATKGFRVMGQRFVIDAYVFGQMIWRRVGTDDNQRGLPKALDFFAALGSDEAYTILSEMGETAYANFDTQMSKVRGELAALQEDTWTENVYWSWLYALHPIIEVKDGRYPEFMRTQAWQRRELNTALGSFTELKHDTILYAKQVMAEMGGGPSEIPKGYVEPNPEAYARLQALAQMTRDGLEARGLLEDVIRTNLDNLIDMLSFLKTVSEKELAGQTLSEDEYSRIRWFGGELEAFSIAAADCSDTSGAGCRDLEDQKAALVADIATGFSPDFPGLAALEEAIGQPTVIVVIVPGSPIRMAVGAVFTYYEFVVDAGSRMTDEEWQAQVAAGTNPPQPDWTGLFMTP
jgi:hypothetical protein